MNLLKLQHKLTLFHMRQEKGNNFHIGCCECGWQPWWIDRFKIADGPQNAYNVCWFPNRGHKWTLGNGDTELPFDRDQQYCTRCGELRFRRSEAGYTY